MLDLAVSGNMYPHSSSVRSENGFWSGDLTVNTTLQLSYERQQTTPVVAAPKSPLPWARNYKLSTTHATFAVGKVSE